jgi:hypothetical protein
MRGLGRIQGYQKGFLLRRAAFQYELLMKFHVAIGRKSTMVMPNVFENHEFHHEKRALCPFLS